MTEPKLDLESYFTFDLAGGDLRYTRGGDRLIAFPMSAMDSVLGLRFDEIQKNLPYTIGLHLGEECGRRVVEAMGGAMKAGISPESFLDNLNAVLALHGLGVIKLETWGDILLFRWRMSEESRQKLLEFQEGVLAGVLRTVTGQPFEATSVDEDYEGARFLAGNAAMIDWTKLWMGEGCGLGEIVGRLHAGRHLQNSIEAG